MKDKFLFSLYIFAAYAKLVVVEFFKLPVLLWILVTLFFTVVFSLKSNGKIWSMKLAAIQQWSTSQETVEQYLSLQHATGNKSIAEKTYEEIPSSYKETYTSFLYEKAFPLGIVSQKQQYWQQAYQNQHFSREAIAALAILSLQEYDKKQAKEYIEMLKNIEPNDKRILLLEQELEKF